MSTTTVPEQQQWQTVDPLGPVKVAAMAAGLEWLAAIIPILLMLLATYCCVKRKRSQSSQTEAATEMATTRPDPVGQDQDTMVEMEPEAKDFILVVDPKN